MRSLHLGFLRRRFAPSRVATALGFVAFGSSRGRCWGGGGEDAGFGFLFAQTAERVHSHSGGDVDSEKPHRVVGL